MNNEPRHRSEPHASEQPGDAYVTQMIDLAADAATGERLADLYLMYGMAFALYLALDGIDQNAATIEADFTNAYVGFYPDRAALIRDTIESFDWGVELDRRLAGDPLLRAMVTFNEDEIWCFANEHYEVVALDAGLYAYELGS